MNEYHGIIIDISLRNPLFIEKFNIIGSKKGMDYQAYKVLVEREDINSVMLEMQKNLVEGFYCHFYDNSSLFVVFSDKIFKAIPNPKSWSKIIKHGRLRGIPEEQLDFSPSKFEEEEW
ncbi:hypothetical protein J4461_04215 [Candidatus Pacearchaeota archaeon]|nr:hypothetical protein [Candidatus Pacearchaeota archaeon]